MTLLDFTAGYVQDLAELQLTSKASIFRGEGGQEIISYLTEQTRTLATNPKVVANSELGTLLLGLLQGDFTLHELVRTYEFALEAQTPKAEQTIDDRWLELLKLVGA